MIYTSKKLENVMLENEEEIILEDLLVTENYNIIFGNYESIEESFKIKDNENERLYVLIRNKESDGVDGKPISHDTCTVKLVRNNYPTYDKMKGIPFQIEPEFKIYKDADTERNRKLVKNDLPFLKEVVKEHRQEILRYWYADPNTVEGRRQMRKIANSMKRKYKQED